MSSWLTTNSVVIRQQKGVDDIQFIGMEPKDEPNYFAKKLKKVITIPRPASVQMYNQFMGGVNTNYVFLALYRSKNLICSHF